MSRHHKAIVDYFPHDATASGGRTLYILQSQFGNDGYAFWFKLLELLATSVGHVFDYNNPTDWQFLLAKTLVNEDMANDILKVLASAEAIDSNLYEHKVIWSQNFVDNIADVYKRRQTNLPQKPHCRNPIKDDDWCMQSHYDPDGMNLEGKGFTEREKAIIEKAYAEAYEED